KTDIIRTKSGKIQGYKENGLEIFKGIPFGEPPVGDLRFQPPIPKKPWDGVYNATEYRFCAFQAYSQLEEFFPKLEPESEDCLNLNIWTPAADKGKRPVMLWIHGGAFLFGGGTDPIYDGSNLARRGDVVVVTINYRLGSFGYLYLPGLPVNVGSLDQVLALEWVRDNIELFGGDPKNVTIFGESAGGFSVVSLCAMPRAKGLFQRVIAQSAPFIDPRKSHQFSKKILKKLGIKMDEIRKLVEIPPEEIIDAQNKVFAKDPTNIIALRPLIDGDTLPIHPLKVFQNGDCADIDFMIGTTLEEAKLFTGLDPSMRKIKDNTVTIGMMVMAGIGREKSEAIINAYKEARKDKYSTEPTEIFNAIITDMMFRIPTTRLLEAQSQHQPNTYNYLLTWASPALKGIFGACHALDLPFVFGTYANPMWDEFVGKGPEIKILSEKIMDAWIAFAHTGNPNHKGLPEWPRYDKEKRATMALGKDCKVINAHFEKERAAWDGLLEV
ncbi:MAG: carboxylesterase/lipase family protein, partial [Promethearchaeota archaeon]